MKYTNSLRWFTLVELIVVITIIGILSTIGFVSYSNYLTWARDSSRKAQLAKISDGLQVYSTDKRLPLPDNYVQVTASGTLVAYQWTAGVDVLEAIDYESGGKDPKDNKYFTYYLAKDRKSFQMLTLLEENEVAGIFPQTYAADYTDRYVQVYGKKLGVLTEPDTNVPIQEVDGLTSLDIVSTTDSYVAHISPTETLSGTGGTLQKSIANASCRRVKETGKSRGNGTYTINPGWNGDITVYCEMENAGGGWTLVARSEEDASGTIWWGVSAGSATDDTDYYSLWSSVTDIDFTEIMVGRYSINKRIDYAITFSANSDDLDITSNSTFATSDCELVISHWLTSAEQSWNHCNRFSYWWDANNTTNYYSSSWWGTSASSGLLEDGFNLTWYSSTYWAWHGKQGMVFVR